MEFKFFVKVKNRYEKRKLIPEKNDNKDFFKRLLLTIEEQLDITKNDILSFFDKDKKVNLSRPKHDDWETQRKIEKLVKIRKLNLNVKERLKNLLQEIEFIICECGSKMYKTPINVPFKKLGSNYLIEDVGYHTIEYVYSCENCYRFIDINLYYSLEYNLNLKEKLIRKGYNFVPNEFGLWHFIEDGNPPNKPPEAE